MGDDYPCGKFGDCNFGCFGSVMRTDRQTNADERFTPATLIGMSNYVTSMHSCVYEHISVLSSFITKKSAHRLIYFHTYIDNVIRSNTVA